MGVRNVRMSETIQGRRILTLGGDLKLKGPFLILVDGRFNPGPSVLGCGRAIGRKNSLMECERRRHLLFSGAFSICGGR